MHAGGKMLVNGDSGISASGNFHNYGSFELGAGNRASVAGNYSQASGASFAVGAAGDNFSVGSLSVERHCFAWRRTDRQQDGRPQGGHGRYCLRHHRSRRVRQVQTGLRPVRRRHSLYRSVTAPSAVTVARAKGRLSERSPASTRSRRGRKLAAASSRRVYGSRGLAYTTEASPASTITLLDITIIRRDI